MKNLTRFANAHFKSLIKNLESFNAIQDKETLHQVRVDVKKIKAVLGIIQYADKKFKRNKYFKPFRNIFRKAGSIREPDVLFKLLLRYSIEGLADDHLARNEKSLVESFRSDIPFFLDVIKEQKKKLKPHLRNISKKDVREYVDKLTKLLASQLTPRVLPDNLHKSRKVIKEILCFSAIEKLKKRELKFYKIMEEEIGQWHDKQVLLQLLQKSSGQAKLQNKVLRAESKADIRNISKLARDFYGKDSSVD